MRSILKLALPVVVSYLGTMSMALVDLAFVGRVGPVSIGAVGLGTAIFSWVMIFGIGLLTSLEYLVAHAEGSGQREEGGRYLIQGAFVAIALGVPLSGALYLVAGALVHLGVQPDVAAETVPYLRVLAPSLTPLLLFIATRQYLQAHGEVRSAMIIMIIANGINAIANYALVFGRLGMPAMGTVGSGWATLISRVWMCFAILAFASFWDRNRNGRILASLPWRVDWKHLGPIVRVGWPSAVQMSLEVGVFALSTGLAARFAAIDLAAHQLVLNTASITFMVPLGISSAAAVLVGKAKGRGKLEEARRVGWRCLQLGVGFMAMSCLVLLLFPRAILGFYTDDPAVIGVGSSILFIAALFQLSDGAQVTGTGILRGLGDTRSSLVMNLVGHWLIGLPLGVLMGFYWGWGLRGIWIGLSIGLTAVALSLVWRWNIASRAATSVLLPDSADH